MFACGNSGVRVATVFEKRVHFCAFVIKGGIVTTEVPQSKKLREWNGIFCVVDERTNVANSYGNRLVCSVHY